MPDKLKIGRITYELIPGKDYVLDNGACWQLTSRRIRSGWHKTIPILSKRAIKEFKAMNIEKAKKQPYKHCTLWIYHG